MGLKPGHFGFYIFERCPDITPVACVLLKVRQLPVDGSVLDTGIRPWIEQMEIHVMQQSNRNLANRKLLTYVLAFTLAMSNMMFSSGAMARSYSDVNAEPTGGTMLADTVLVRPAMLVASVGGIVAFVVTLPFSLLGGNTGEAGKKLVVDPLAFTFVRPLGEL